MESVGDYGLGFGDGRVCPVAVSILFQNALRSRLWHRLGDEKDAATVIEMAGNSIG